MFEVVVDFVLYNLAPSLLAGLWAMAALALVVRVLDIESALLHNNMLFMPLIKSVLVLLGLSTVLPFLATDFWMDVKASAVPVRYLGPLYLIWLGIAYIAVRTIRTYSAKRMIASAETASPDSRVMVSMERMLERYQKRSIMESCSTECQLVLKMPRPDLYISHDEASPAVVIGNPPTLVVPERLVGELDNDELDGVLAHELAHVAIERPQLWCDATLRRIVALTSPTGYVVNRVLVRQEELACDEIAAQVTGRPAALAGALVKTHRFRTQIRRVAPVGVAALLGNERPLKGRIMRLLGTDYGQSRVGKFQVIKVIAAWTVLCVLIFAV